MCIRDRDVVDCLGMLATQDSCRVQVEDDSLGDPGLEDGQVLPELFGQQVPSGNNCASISAETCSIILYSASVIRFVPKIGSVGSGRKFPVGG